MVMRVKKGSASGRLLVLVLLLSLVIPALAALVHSSAQEIPVIPALDTKALLEYGGKEVIVEGKVVHTNYARQTKGQPTYLDFHDPYKGYFTALIWGDDRKNFTSPPGEYYLNKTVRVKGKIEIYRGTPEIIARTPSQIEIVTSRANNSTLAAAVTSPASGGYAGNGRESSILEPTTGWLVERLVVWSFAALLFSHTGVFGWRKWKRGVAKAINLFLICLFFALPFVYAGSYIYWRFFL